jgi:membrane protein DedA with SNARE-associated domain
METTFIPETLSFWLTQYGSFALFALLALGIFALPIPDETLMVLAGILVAHNKLSVFPTALAAILGAVTGISVSYVIGRVAGTFLIRKYGHWLGITEAKMQRVHNGFERVGPWALLMGYFIPGVRHLTGYVAGITEMHYKYFALFAYGGATIWAAVFLSLGYFLGDRWEYMTELLEERWEYCFLAAVAIIIVFAVAFLGWRVLRKRKNNGAP